VWILFPCGKETAAQSQNVNCRIHPRAKATGFSALSKSKNQKTEIKGDMLDGQTKKGKLSLSAQQNFALV
jgi:hypothetical protein